MSSNEAEYMEGPEVFKEAVWRRRVSIEMGIAKPDAPPVRMKELSI